MIGLHQRALRLAMAIAALGLALLSAWHAAATVMGGENPVLVQKLDPTNPEALPMLVDLQSARTPEELGMPAPRMVPLVRETLERQALAPRALRQLAAFEAKSGDDATSRRLLALGERVSRRDPLLNIMLAKNAARDNQPAALIAHLDTALSTFRSADAQVFPLLVQPLTSADFRGYLKGYMDRPWAEPFMLYAAQNARARDVLALARSAPLMQRQPHFERFRTELVTHLVRQGASGDAIDYVADVAPDQSILTTGGITKATVDPRFAPVTWRLTNAGGIYLSAEGARVVVALDPAARGGALERVMRLAPGSYRLQARTMVPAGQDPVTERWTATCLRGAAEQALGNREGAVRTGEAALAFTVPGGCDSVRLALELVSGSDQNPVDFDYEWLRLQQGSAS